MQIYIIIFLNFIMFQALSYTEINLFIQKLNYILLVNVMIIYSIGIYKYKTSKKEFHINPINLLILITLIIYNYIILNEIVLSTSIFLFVSFFIIDIKYNSIYKESTSKSNNYEDNTQYSRASWDDIRDSINQDDKENYTEFEKEEEPEQEPFQENYILDIQLEEKLIILGLSLDFNRKDLKKAYRKKAQENHPDKHSDERKDAQTLIMKDINSAKCYLENILKKSS